MPDRPRPAQGRGRGRGKGAWGRRKERKEEGKKEKRKGGKEEEGKKKKRKRRKEDYKRARRDDCFFFLISTMGIPFSPGETLFRGKPPSGRFWWHQPPIKWFGKVIGMLMGGPPRISLGWMGSCWRFMKYFFSPARATPSN